MTIRTIIMALTIPLFLLMAAINGAVLYFQEQSELTRALTDQTLAAAVVTGEFAKEMDDPAQVLGASKRQQAIAAAAAQVEGLQTLDLVEQSGTIARLVDGPEVPAPAIAWNGGDAVQSVTLDESGEAPFFVAIVPAGAGRAAVARVDAAPLLANRMQIAQIVALIVLAVGVIAAILSWYVAHRVVRELDWNGRYLTTGEQSEGARFTIRETKDLSDAAGLMCASHETAEARLRRDAERRNRERSADSAARNLHASLLADVDAAAGPARIAVRVCGSVSPGTFHAVVASGDDAHVVIGRCEGEGPAAQLVNAVAARRFIEEQLGETGAEACLALATKAFAIAQIEHLSFAPETPLGLVSLADDRVQTDARAILASGQDMTPGKLLNSIAALLEPDGIFAAIAPIR